MTRKHFKGIAEAIKDTRAELERRQAGSTRERMTGTDAVDYLQNELARFCRTQNAHFDGERFARACRPIIE